MDRRIDVLSLYPKDMNIYGDSGNVLSIRRRLKLFGYHVQLHAYNQDDEWPEHVDLVLGGGGQDQGQRKIIRDLFKRADAIRALANDGVPMLMICGMYQLFGDYFETIEGDRLPGIGILGLHTIGQEERLI
ncbi:MAG: glutamine amidotransferase, partial [Bifidobacterium crudilactis]|nr:glutamine amidotransferase [Bifidobacterium crudilactis]